MRPSIMGAPELESDAGNPAPRDATEPACLRTQVMRGGIYLAARGGASIVIGSAGALLLARQLGPSAFGVYVTLIAISGYAQLVASAGIDVYLVRGPEAKAKSLFDSAFTLMTMLALLAACLLGLVFPVVASLVNMPETHGLGRLIVLTLPFSVVAQVPLAKLERDLRFATVAKIEVLAHLALYATAIPLAYQGWGAAAGVTGWMARQGMLAVSLFAVAGFCPSLRVDRTEYVAMARYGLGFSSSLWIWRLRDLVNPLVVGRYGGPAAVGHVALAIRLVENLAFVKGATWRLSIAALGRVQDDPGRLRGAIREAMPLQLLALGPLLVLFGTAGTAAVPVLFGPRWLPTMGVFPFIAVAYLANAMFNVHSSALYAVGRNWSVTRFHFVHVAVFSLAAAVLVPRHGLVGYGYAELAALIGYAVIHRFATGAFGPLDYRVPAVWFVAFTAAVFAPQTAFVSLVGLAAAGVWAPTRSEVRRLVRGVSAR